MARIRVSCSNLVRVNLDEGIVLSVNRNRARRGLKVYSPIGGVLKADDSGLKYLKRNFGCEFEKEDGDLRFLVDDLRISEFENWFFGYKDRELSPNRELNEELVDEEGVFDYLPEQEMHLERLANIEERKVTDRTSQEGILTQRYFEVWNLEFSAKYQEAIRRNLVKPDTSLLLATEQEIRGLRSKEGHEIRDSALALVLDKTKTHYRTINSGLDQVLLYKE